MDEELVQSSTKSLWGQLDEFMQKKETRMERTLNRCSYSRGGDVDVNSSFENACRYIHRHANKKTFSCGGVTCGFKGECYIEADRVLFGVLEF